MYAQAVYTDVNKGTRICMGHEKLTRRYGPYTWVSGTHWYVRPVYVGVKYAPVYTGCKYGPHVRLVFMGSVHQPLQT